MNVDVESLVTYPMESDDWIITVAIGGVMSIFSFLIVPWFLIAGYMIRAIRAGMEGADEPPVFDEWGELLKEGVVASVIGFVYQLIPLAVFVVFVGGSFLALLTGSEAGAGIGFFGLLGGMFLWWILSLVFGYVGLAGIANYAKEGTIGAGFDFGTITQVATTGDYVMAWVYVIVLNVVVGIVVGLLNIIPFLGAIVGAFIGFYALIIASWLWGDGFASATNAGAGVDRDPEAAAV